VNNEEQQEKIQPGTPPTGRLVSLDAFRGITIMGMMCYWLIDVKGFHRWASPFVIFGSNAIFVYVLSSLAAKLMHVIKLHPWLYRKKIFLKI